MKNNITKIRSRFVDEDELIQMKLELQHARNILNSGFIKCKKCNRTWIEPRKQYECSHECSLNPISDALDSLENLLKTFHIN
jgi:hypothetical protein